MLFIDNQTGELTGSYCRPLDVIIVSARSKMSAPTSAIKTEINPELTHLNTFKQCNEESQLLTLAFHCYCDVHVYS